jgi:hypothetical protein
VVWLHLCTNCLSLPPSPLSRDSRHTALLTATTRLHVWPVKDIVHAVNLTHDAPLCCALYNRAFLQVVTSDETAVVCAWAAQTGQQVFRYREQLRAPSKLTAMCFDDGGRRLVTGFHDGSLRMTNFSSGECLTEVRSFRQSFIFQVSPTEQD